MPCAASALAASFDPFWSLFPGPEDGLVFCVNSQTPTKVTLPSESAVVASAVTDSRSYPLNVHVPPGASTTRCAGAMALSTSPVT